MKLNRLLFEIGLALVLPGQALHAQQSDADRQALAQLRAEAEKGGAQSQFQMGLAFFLGQFGLATNYLEAVNWMRKAAEQHYARAHVNLGRCYENGQGVARDAVEAMNWYRKAAEQKAAQAQHTLGVCYAKGQCVSTTHAEAATWCRKAAGQSAQW